MPKQHNPADISYLAFEGGGGKGIVYLGVIKALEEVFTPPRPQGRLLPHPGIDDLPVIDFPKGLFDLSQPIAQRKLKGVSGSSAGAITALMVALGMSSDEIAEEINTPSNDLYRINGLVTQPEKIVVNELEQFVEDPDMLNNKAVDPNPALHQFVNTQKGYPLIMGALYDPIIQGLLTKLGTGDSTIASRRIFRSETRGGDFTKRLDLSAYIHSFLFNRGLIAGKRIRMYFANLVTKYLQKRFKGMLVSGGTLTFKEFFSVTGVDLVVSGTNISRRLSKYFSVGSTPDFPVAEAVAISMNIPFFFKPVLIDRPVIETLGPNDPYNIQYTGLWVDGGMLMNYPLHAFDNLVENTIYPSNPQYVKIAKPPLEGEDHDLQPGTLGFRLVEKDGRPFDVRDVYRSDQGLIVGELVGDIMDTFMYSGDGGQIRSLADRRATIDLDASGLKLLDFAGPTINRIRKEMDIAIKKEQLIHSAYEATKSSLQK